MFCPSCGSEISYDQRFAHLVVCEFCQSSLVANEEALRIAGKMAVLAEPSGILAVGAMGRVNEQDFQVLGRARYGYEGGFWEEWFIRWDNESTAWLSEDGKNYMLEEVHEVNAADLPLNRLEAGEVVVIKGKKFLIREQRTAQCEGGQGQLPFPLVIGEKTPFWDLEGEESGVFGTLELDGENYKLFIGQRIDPNELSTNVDPEEQKYQPKMQTMAAEGARERVSYSGATAATIRCSQCGQSSSVDLSQPEAKCSHCDASLELPKQSVVCPACSAAVSYASPDCGSRVCDYCGTQIAMQGGETSIIGEIRKAEEQQKSRSAWPLGTSMRINGEEFTLVGYMEQEEHDEGEVYKSLDYLFYGEKWGYRWLTEYDGQYSIEEKLKKPPMVSWKSLDNGQENLKVDYAGKKWTSEDGVCEAQITWLEGEFPWVAQKGDKVRYAEFELANRSLVCEYSGQEVEWSTFRSMPRSEVAGLLRTDPSKLALSRSEKHQKGMKGGLIARLLFILLVIAGMIFSAFQKKEIFDTTLSYDEYVKGVEIKPLLLGPSGHAYGIKLYSNIDNTWIATELELRDSTNTPVFRATPQLSYYSGVDGGESWSEGSQDETTLLRVSTAGKYSLFVRGEAEYKDIYSLRVTIYQDFWILRWQIVLLVLLILESFLYLIRKAGTAKIMEALED
jgi:Zn finger protein HypA/HybF involved in hydrogenase expression